VRKCSALGRTEGETWIDICRKFRTEAPEPRGERSRMHTRARRAPMISRRQRRT
jgi:hypothetical protein